MNEIRICFTKSMELTDCDGILFEDVFIGQQGGKVITNCNLNKPIFYPEKIPLSQYDKTHLSPYDLRMKFLEEYKRKEAKDNKMMKILVNIYKLIQLLRWTTM